MDDALYEFHGRFCARFQSLKKPVDGGLEDPYRDEPRDGFDEEYDSLKDETNVYRDKQPRTAGMHDLNKKKNRYKDILPFDSTRVKLKEDPDIPNSDYINANFITGVSGSKEYIASQAPNNLTITDFWRMIWEQNVRCVVMACNETEGSSKIKCHRYWPTNVQEPMVFGKVTVTLDNCNEKERYFIVRSLKVSMEGVAGVRTVNQYHYTAWPDHGVPGSVVPIMDMLACMRTFQPGHEAPIIIHCSAGCGRTGTLLVIDYVWNILQARTKRNMKRKGGGSGSFDIDIYSIVKAMREERQSLIQNKEQYETVYYTIRVLLSKYLKQMNPSFEEDTEDQYEYEVEYVNFHDVGAGSKTAELIARATQEQQQPQPQQQRLDVQPQQYENCEPSPKSRRSPDVRVSPTPAKRYENTPQAEAASMYENTAPIRLSETKSNGQSLHELPILPAHSRKPAVPGARKPSATVTPIQTNPSADDAGVKKRQGFPTPGATAMPSTVRKMSLGLETAPLKKPASSETRSSPEKDHKFGSAVSNFTKKMNNNLKKVNAWGKNLKGQKLKDEAGGKIGGKPTVVTSADGKSTQILLDGVSSGKGKGMVKGRSLDDNAHFGTANEKFSNRPTSPIQAYSEVVVTRVKHGSSSLKDDERLPSFENPSYGLMGKEKEKADELSGSGSIGSLPPAVPVKKYGVGDEVEGDCVVAYSMVGAIEKSPQMSKHRKSTKSGQSSSTHNQVYDMVYDGAEGNQEENMYAEVNENDVHFSQSQPSMKPPRVAGGRRGQFPITPESQTHKMKPIIFQGKAVGYPESVGKPIGGRPAPFKMASAGR